MLGTLLAYAVTLSLVAFGITTLVGQMAVGGFLRIIGIRASPLLTPVVALLMASIGWAGIAVAWYGIGYGQIPMLLLATAWVIDLLQSPGLVQNARTLCAAEMWVIKLIAAVNVLAWLIRDYGIRWV